MKTKLLYSFLAGIAFCAYGNTPASPLSDRLRRVTEEMKWVNPQAMHRYLADMKRNHRVDTAAWGQKLAQIEALLPIVRPRLAAPADTVQAISQAEEILALKRQIMLANPLLDGDQLLVAHYRLGNRARKAMAPDLGTAPNNWSSLLSSRRHGYDAEIAVLSGLRGERHLKTVYKPAADVPVSDIQLHWDAGRVLFSSLDSARKWNIYEIGIDGTNLHRKITVNEPDLEFCDANYLPDGRIVATTNIGYNGVPCVHGDDPVANLISYDPQTGRMQRLTFDQDGNWNPVVIPNGRIMYTRWEYTDLTHYFSRMVMHMNPDGTENKALYGSGSYFPNSTFDVKPVSKTNNRFIGIVSGHHGIARSGRLILFDPAKGRQEEKGMIQELPFSTRKIVPEIKDELVDGVWPQFIKPYPLNETYYLVAAKPYPDALWGIYLVDLFDNLTLIAEAEGEGFISPIPVRPTEMPPVIPSKIKPGEKTATVFIQDIYEGEGTQGIPRGTIKSIRVFAYEYAYVKAPSDHDAQGIQSGWDIKRVLGTVPVEADGSALFTIPANTPVSLQPLDKHGAAVQWMRSWIAGMPGEIVSCIGCHEDQNKIPIPKRTAASQITPHALQQPEGGVRPFTFRLEVQPVLNRNCVSCHNGEKDIPDFRKDRMVVYKRGIATKIERHFDQSYLDLHPYVYRQGPEADIRVLKPYEYYVNNSELIRLLQNGHHGVTLPDADWRTLYTWIDLNVPYFGAFTQLDLKKEAPARQVQRRMELAEKYSGVRVDWQKEITDYAAWLKTHDGEKTVAVTPPAAPEQPATPRVKGFPFDADAAKQKQGARSSRTLTIAPGISIELVWIPAGKFVMGDNTDPSASPAFATEVTDGFWMSATEITNEQFCALFPKHDSRYIGQLWKDHTTPGYAANRPEQPVIRVSWDEANAFCRMLGEKQGCRITLPSETQWEWAARAGSDAPFWYGGLQAGFGAYENLADSSLVNLAVQGVNPVPMSPTNPMRAFWDYQPKVKEVNDGRLIAGKPAAYRSNPWGLYDMHGNVAEWTSSDAQPYPLGKRTAHGTEKKVVRGGSWIERPRQATAAARKIYYPWQRPFQVGFRIVMEEKAGK